METLMILYMIALIYRNTKASCTAIAEWFDKISHDQFSRMLAEKRNWPTLLWSYFAIKMVGEEGYLIIDDTVLEKFGYWVFGVNWVYSSKFQKSILGIHIVMLIWTDGRKRVPLGIKIWRNSKQSKIVLASKLLRWARKLEIKPQYVVFDSWYSAKKLLKLIRQYNWHYITRMKKNRKLSGKSLSQYWPHRFGHGIGMLAGQLEVLVVKDGNRFLATSDIALSVKEVKLIYTLRQQIEEVFKILKDQLAWSKSPARNKTTQTAHLHLCLMAFCVLQTEALNTNSTPYRIRKSLFRQAVPDYSLMFQPFIRAA